MNKFFEYIKYFWLLLFPHSCEACGNVLYKNEEVICTNCLFDLPRTSYSFEPDNPIVQLFAGRLNISYGTALFTFHKGSRFRKLLHSLKYKSKPEIGIILGKELGAEMNRDENFKNIDYIIPVPLHPKRQKERGYNQSEMIGEGISKITKIPMLSDCLLRNAETVSQTKVSKEERWKNVSGKFIIKDKEIIKNKHVLLIDDIVTTGSTLEACGEALLTVPNLKLSIAVLAKA